MEIPRLWRWHQEVVWPFARSALQAQIAEAAEKLNQLQENNNSNGNGGDIGDTAKEPVTVIGVLEEVTSTE